jgi:hypothetical protein
MLDGEEFYVISWDAQGLMKIVQDMGVVTELFTSALVIMVGQGKVSYFCSSFYSIFISFWVCKRFYKSL